MVTCRICNREFKSLRSLSVHLMHNKDTHIDSESYYLKYISGYKLCSFSGCDNRTKFMGIVKGYGTYCSTECSKLDSKNRISKTKKTMIEKYGVDNCSKLEEIKRKKIETSRKNYGTNYPWQSEKGRNEQIDGIRNKYGVDHICQVEEIKTKAITGMVSYKQSEYGRRVQSEINRRVKLNKIFESETISKFCIPLFDKADYVDNKTDYKWKCVKCNTEFEDNTYCNKIPRCPTCFPRLSCRESNLEKEVVGYIRTFYDGDILENEAILDKKEIDIYLPEFKLGIEFDGLYWHKEGFVNKNYHLNKTNIANELGIKLLHIFEDEWLYKQDIVKTIIKNKMGLCDNKLYARKCYIKELDNKIANKFLDENHIQGYVNGKHIGLFEKHNNRLVQIISFGNSRFDKKHKYEIYRFCSLRNLSVVGGFSKLIKYIRKKYNGSFVTYADLRYSDGNVYNVNGFTYSHTTSPNYFYMDKYCKHRYPRQMFQKHKLKNMLDVFDESLSEWDNMQLNGYSRIWDCGNKVFYI